MVKCVFINPSFGHFIQLSSELYSILLYFKTFPINLLIYSHLSSIFNFWFNLLFDIFASKFWMWERSKLNLILRFSPYEPRSHKHFKKAQFIKKINLMCILLFDYLHCYTTIFLSDLILDLDKTNKYVYYLSSIIIMVEIVTYG